MLPIKSLLFHNLEHYHFNYSNLCFYTSQNVIEISAFVVQNLELCNKCTAKHSTCTGSLVSICLMTTIHSSYREILDNRVTHSMSTWERGGQQTLDTPRWLQYIHHPNKTAKALNMTHIHFKSQHNVWDLHSSQILYMYIFLHAIK